MKLGKTDLGTYKVNIISWNGERLSPSIDGIIATDTETELVKAWTDTPDVITLQAFDGTNCYYVYPKDIDNFFRINSGYKFVFHNFAFDHDVICKLVDNVHYFTEMIENDQLWDTAIMYRLLHLAKEGYVPFKYNLAKLLKEYRQLELPKDDHLRLNWGDYKDQPFTSIPADMIEYGAKDVIGTYMVYKSILTQMQCLPYIPIDKRSERLSHKIQLKGDLALNSIYKNGIGFDLKKATELLSNLDERLSEIGTQLAHWGWVRGMKGGKIAFENAAKMLGFIDELPRTSSGELSSKADDLESYMHIPFIKDYVEFHKLEKLTSFIRKLDSEQIHPRYTLLRNTGRTSCSKPNFQQLPREGGIRQLFKANPGNKFLITDYSTLELATLAQVCYNRFGKSTMGDKINAGDDLHKYYASVLYSKPISDVTKGERQSAKAANFGFPGGLGINTFIEFSRGYGLELTEDVAKDMKEAWMSAFPEMATYLKGEAGYTITETGRLRGRTTFCAEKNTPFQGLAADGAKIALYNLYRSNFTLRGFVHDEIITEVSISEDKYSKIRLGIPKKKEEEILDPREVSVDLSNLDRYIVRNGDWIKDGKEDDPIFLKMIEQERIMIEGMKEVCPDVKISVESMITDFYTK